MKTPRLIPVFGGDSANPGEFVNQQIYWPGGPGWLKVIGTFSGASAVVNVEAQASQPPLAQVSVFPHPDFPSGISAAGTYVFSSPEGSLTFQSPTIDPGDSLTIEAVAIVIDARS